jgi:hypothetical protein
MLYLEVYLKPWRTVDTLGSGPDEIILAYGKPVASTFVGITASRERMVIFSCFLNVLPPHDIMSPKLLGGGKNEDASSIIRFLSSKLGGPVRFDLTLNGSASALASNLSGTFVEVIPAYRGEAGSTGSQERVETKV